MDLSTLSVMKKPNKIVIQHKKKKAPAKAPTPRPAKAPTPRPKKTPVKTPVKKTTPKKTTKPVVSKKNLLDGLGIIGDVAKDKLDPTDKEINDELTKSKGKVSFAYFMEILGDIDSEGLGEVESNIGEGYNIEFFIHQKLNLPKKDTFEELTDKQQERLRKIIDKEIRKDMKEYNREFYNNSIKGKKFNFAQLKKTIRENYGV